MKHLRRIGLVALYGLLCCCEFLVLWGKERCGIALKGPATPDPKETSR